MEVTIRIPDDIATRIGQSGSDLSRRALESLAIEELRAGRITEPELGRMLGLARLQIDGFLKAHGVYQDYTLEDFEQERQALKELGNA
jgi:predicted HTH domain antitoxin